ncbi:hypothetical protein Hanom_Chr07g00608631 [Helianthus anomalus]
MNGFIILTMELYFFFIMSHCIHQYYIVLKFFITFYVCFLLVHNELCTFLEHNGTAFYI